MPQRVPLERYMDVVGVQAKLSRQFISTTLDQFANQAHIRELANEQNIKGRLFDKAYQSFRLLCCSENASPQSMEPALRIVLSDIKNQGTPCDMVTGENRLFAFDSDNPAAHVAVTVEMLSPEHRTELCVIDEIQMLRDPLRGGAWTKALLGAAADEVHLCGEESAYDIICRLLDPIGEHVDFRRYERKGELIVIVYCTGEVMTLADGDAKVLEKLMREPIEPIDQAGIAPSFDQIEERYMFCFTPIASGPHPFLNSSFVKMVRRYAEGNAITIAWVRQLVAPELKVVNQIEAINGLVDVYEFMGAYLWLSYRFEEHFCDRSSVRELQKECGRIIQESIQKMLSENEKKAKEMPTLTLRHRQEEPAVLEESELRLLKKSLPGKRVVVHKQKVGLQGTFTTLITNMRKSRKTVI
uniref:RNA helicase n=1 Tax=Globodera pallida TaxID=36090 RepID=A0A183BZG7_GLOPA